MLIVQKVILPILCLFNLFLLRLALLAEAVVPFCHWELKFTSGNQYWDYDTRNGTWRDVYFQFKGLGIRDIVAEPRSIDSNAPVEAEISYLAWNKPGEWCYGCVRVRALNNGEGGVILRINGSPYWCYSILIGYPENSVRKN